MNLLMKMRRIKDLSHSERQVVNFILNDPEAASSLGIAELAARTYTSTSTVMRLCKKLGMEGFMDFRLQLAADVTPYLHDNVMSEEHETVATGDTLAQVVEKVTANNVRAVLDIKRFNSLETLETVITMMSDAKQLDFFGSGVSNLILHDAMLKALRLGIPSTCYSYYSESAMFARTCPRDHLAIILSYTGQTAETLSVARYLKQSQVPSVSITSHTENALLELCNINLFVDSYESVFRIGGMSSRLSSQHLLDILFSGYMTRNYEALQDPIQKTFLPEAFHHLGTVIEDEEFPDNK